MLNTASNYRNFQTQPQVRFNGLSDGVKPYAKLTNTDEETKNKPSSKNKVILGTTLTGLTALGIYLATRGKTKPAKAHTPSEPIQNSTELLENSLDKFRELGGKLVKGKAIDKDGNLYTGTLVKETPSGVTLSLKYENGVLIESSKAKGKEFLNHKKYEYRENGLSKISDDSGIVLEKYIDKNKKQLVIENHRNNNTFIKDLETNRILLNKHQCHIYGENGNLKYLRNISDSGHYTVFRKDGKTPVLKREADYITFYNSDGTTKCTMINDVNRRSKNWLLETSEGKKIIFEDNTGYRNETFNNGFRISVNGTKDSYNKGELVYKNGKKEPYEYIRIKNKIVEKNGNHYGIKLCNSNDGNIAIYDINTKQIRILNNNYSEAEVKEVIKSAMNLKNEAEAYKVNGEDLLTQFKIEDCKLASLI